MYVLRLLSLFPFQSWWSYWNVIVSISLLFNRKRFMSGNTNLFVSFSESNINSRSIQSLLTTHRFCLIDSFYWQMGWAMTITCPGHQNDNKSMTSNCHPERKWLTGPMPDIHQSHEIIKSPARSLEAHSRIKKITQNGACISIILPAINIILCNWAATCMLAIWTHRYPFDAVPEIV